jgi:integrase
VIINNPIRDFQVKNNEERVVHSPISEQELNELYYNYCIFLEEKPENPLIRRHDQAQISKRHKLVVSLLIFQGLDRGNIERLTVADLNVNQGPIYIASSPKSNSRVLNLHPSQLIIFYQYLHELPEDQQQLFNVGTQGILFYILAELKAINPVVTSVRHIKDSVLINWIKQHEKRKAQYMIGHKYVSSTEKFEKQDTTELSELMEKFHLF